MSNIKQLIPDIYATLNSEQLWFNSEIADKLGFDISAALQQSLNPHDRSNRRGLRLSQMRPWCPRSLWYSVHHPEMEEQVKPWTKVKFAYGHIIEAFAICLAKASGHEVTGEQDELFVDGISGHRDCVIDGCIVDVKSTNSRSFDKFKNGTLAQDDLFGYLDQLDGYLVGSLEDPLVRVKDTAYLFAIDKTLGHMCLYEHRIREEHIRERVRSYKQIVESDTPPACTCGLIRDRESGSLRLDTRASYNAFKYCCFPELRTFLSPKGPIYITHIVNKPNYPEVDMNGNFVN